MKRRLPLLLPLLILAVGVLGMRGLRALRAEPQRAQQEVIVPAVEVETVHFGAHRFVVRAQGTVTPRTTSRLVAEVAGRVLRVSEAFEPGAFFAAGDTLLWLDDRDARAALANAAAQLAAARLRLQLQEEERRVAEEEWKSFASETPSDLVLRKPQLAEARASVHSAEALKAKAARDLERTRLTAPYDGRVQRKLADVGDYLGPGTPAAELYAVDYAELRLPIPDDELAYLDVPLGMHPSATEGAEVRLSAVFAQRLHRWSARIHRSEGEIDPVTRMVHLVARIDDPYGRRHRSEVPLAAGMFVEAEILGRTVEACSVPSAALYGDRRVLVVHEGGRIEVREVEVLRRNRERTILGEGLQDGERVCVTPLGTVVEGMEVRAIETGEGASR